MGRPSAFSRSGHANGALILPRSAAQGPLLHRRKQEHVSGLQVVPAVRPSWSTERWRSARASAARYRGATAAWPHPPPPWSAPAGAKSRLPIFSTAGKSLAIYGLGWHPIPKRRWDDSSVDPTRFTCALRTSITRRSTSAGEPSRLYKPGTLCTSILPE